MMDGVSTICTVPVFPLVILLLQALQLKPPQWNKINQDTYLDDEEASIGMQYFKVIKAQNIFMHAYLRQNNMLPLDSHTH